MSILIKKYLIETRLVLKTGLHIGGTNTAMGIGGPDKLVIRNPLDNKPIIPGSSMKGKMRSLLEISNGHIGRKNGPTDNPDHIEARLFGTSASDEKSIPSRLIVRDGYLITGDERFTDTDMLYTEAKTEVSIDRLTSRANPRTFERVPAGAEFALHMVLNIFEGEEENELKEGILAALRLVNDDYLGGQGSRGYGQVEVQIQKVIERPITFYHGKKETETEVTDNWVI